MNEFKIGEKVEHVLSGDWLLVTQIYDYEPKYECRTKDMKLGVFNTFELRKIKAK